ncbi:MAG: metallophosphoesterase family protein [Candidatus Acidiferrum sp.]
MKVAAIYDMHGNLPALEAVLHEIRREKVDQVVIGGDVIPGPMAREALECLLQLETPVQFIVGNCEVAVLAQMEGVAPSNLPEQAKEAIRWTAEQLDVELKGELASWPKTLQFRIPGLGEVLFCHATPRNENECFTRMTAEERLEPVFDGLGVDAVICGHTHMQFDRNIGKVRIVNAGSVGMPFGEPGAYWAMLGPGIDLRRTEYDLVRAGERIRETNYPHADDFAARSVLQPPGEEAMLEVFRKVELK